MSIHFNRLALFLSLKLRHLRLSQMLSALVVDITQWLQWHACQARFEAQNGLCRGQCEAESVMQRLQC